jgi:hypothetical protein
MFDFLSEVSGLTAAMRDSHTALTRIADALERLSPPPIPDREPLSAPAAGAPSGDPPGPAGPTFAESPEDYQARTSQEAALAMSLGVAPWSPAFQTAIQEMRDVLMRPHVEEVQDEEGNWHRANREGATAEEAEQIVRDAFRLARAEANERIATGQTTV